MQLHDIPVTTDLGTVQNVDRNIRPKDYNGLEGKIRVTSIFRTLQGEAPFSGYPAVFVRLSGCNFGAKTLEGPCRWCDSNFQFDQGTDYDVDDLVNEVLKVSKQGDLVVITGGEPTLQLNLIPFLEQLSDVKFRIQIETNGTQPMFFKSLRDAWVRITRNIEEHGIFVVTSPKAVYKAQTIPKPSDQIISVTGAYRFVVSADPQSPHHVLPDWVSKVRAPVYVSPMAVYKKAYVGEVSSIWDTELVDQEKTAQNYQYAAQYALENNFRLSVQTHLLTAIP